MSHKKTQHTKQFKLDAVNYRKEHPDLTQAECATVRIHSHCDYLSPNEFEKMYERVNSLPAA